MGAGGNDVWDEWDRLTRFLESTRLAYDREIQSLSSLRGNSLTVRSTGSYEVPLDHHLAAVKDEGILFASVLIHSYALAESAAADRLGKSLRQLEGIEEWGGELLASSGSSWKAVDGGEAGAVEIAVVRNALAHGTHVLDPQAIKRLTRAGARGRTVGDSVSLHYRSLLQHRKRLRSLLSAGGIHRRP